MEHLEMKNRTSRIKIIGLCAIVATSFTTATQAVAATETASGSKAQRETASEERFDAFFGDAATNMKQMRERAAQKRKEMAQGKSKGVTGEYKSSTNGGTLQDIATREDAESVFYDVKIADLDSTSVNTDVKDGYITITGLTEKKSEYNDKNSSGQGLMKSGFERRFPLPKNVDGHKMKMTAEKDKVILQFPKIKS